MSKELTVKVKIKKKPSKVKVPIIKHIKAYVVISGK
jgi:hypothetical protein